MNDIFITVFLIFRYSIIEKNMKYQNSVDKILQSL